MKAGMRERLFIIVKTICATLLISLASLHDTRRSRLTRERCDKRLRWWSSKLLSFVSLSFRTFNPHHVEFPPDRPTIIMSNHSSLYDIPLIFASLPGSIRMIAKKELFETPLWGRGMKVAEFIPIDRDNRRQAFRDLEEARKKMESGIILWVAPEGTRSLTGELYPFKRGGFMLAQKTGATIIPVGIRGAYDVLPAKTYNFNIGRRAEIHIGEPIDARKFPKKGIDALMSEVELQIRRLGDLPIRSTVRNGRSFNT